MGKVNFQCCDNKVRPGIPDGFLLVRKRTIFFFCLDPSLQTKTTAVLNTKKQQEKKFQLSLKTCLYHSLDNHGGNLWHTKCSQLWFFLPFS